MPKRIMLTIGCCEKQMFADVRDSVCEKLNTIDRTAISFKMLHELTDARAAVNELHAKVHSDCMAEKHNPSVVMLFDGSETDLAQLLDLMDDFESSKEELGIWDYTFHLLWMIEEQPLPRHDYRKFLDVILDHEALFSHIYILSDKRSDLSHGKNERINGAALLINTLLESVPATGLYTVGAGKMNITPRELCDYARHQAVRAIRNQAINHSSLLRMDDICATAFAPGLLKKADELPAHLQQIASQHIVSTFCYIQGESAVTSQVSAPAQIDFSADLEAWLTQVKRSLNETPFIEDAINFFRQDGRFIDFTEEVENRACMHENGDKVKPGLFGAKKAVGNAYNAFLIERQKRLNDYIHQFCQQWRAMGVPLYRLALQYQERRDMYASSYERENTFINMCVSRTQCVTTKIDHQLGLLQFSHEQCGPYISGDQASCEQQWNTLMDWIVRETRAADAAGDLLQDVVAKDAGSLFSEVLTPIRQQSIIYLSCPSHDRFPQNANTVFFLSSAFNVTTLQNTVRSPGIEFLSVKSSAYKNAEAISLLQLSSGFDRDAIRRAAGELTAFVPHTGSQYTRTHTPIQPLEESASINQNRIPLYEESEPENDRQGGNPWRLNVIADGKGYKLTLDWADPEIDSIRLMIHSQYRRNTPIFIRQSDFLDKGHVDIDELVGYGPQTAEISTRSTTLSELVFPGRTQQVYLNISEKAFILDTSTTLDLHKITVDRLDDDEHTPLPDDVCRNLLLVLDGKDAIHMPMPQIKRHRQTWTLYVEQVPFDVQLGDEHDGFYEIHY